MLGIINHNVFTYLEQCEVDRMNNSLKTILNKVDPKIVTYNYDHFIKKRLFSTDEFTRKQMVKALSDSGIDISDATHMLISTICDPNNVYLDKVSDKVINEISTELFKLKECNIKKSCGYIVTKDHERIEFQKIDSIDNSKIKDFVDSYGVMQNDCHRVSESFLNKEKSSKIETVGYDMYGAFARLHSYIIVGKSAYDFANNVYYKDYKDINKVLHSIHINQMGFKEYSMESIKTLLSKKKVPINVIYDTALNRIKTKSIKVFPNLNA